MVSIINKCRTSHANYMREARLATRPADKAFYLDMAGITRRELRRHLIFRRSVRMNSTPFV